MTAIDHNPFNK